MTNEENFSEKLEHFIELFGRRAIGDFVAFAKVSGLSMPQINVLMHLYYLKSCEIANIKKFISGDFVAATQIVDRLAQRGLVERTLLPEDHRVRMVGLTDQGKELVQASINARRQWIRELSEQFSVEDQAAIDRSISLLICKMESE